MLEIPTNAQLYITIYYFNMSSLKHFKHSNMFRSSSYHHQGVCKFFVKVTEEDRNMFECFICFNDDILK
jgi:hypothetical protein